MSKRLVGFAVAILCVVGIVAMLIFMSSGEDAAVDPVGSGGSSEAGFQVDSNILEAADYLEQGDVGLAVENAKKAAEAARAEKDFDTIVTAADLVRYTDPQATMDIYKIAYELHLESEAPTQDDELMGYYWVTADLAEQAGLYDEAIDYYTKAVAVHDPDDPNQKALFDRSNEALKRLQ